MKVWNLIFSYTDYDHPCESYVRVKTFSSEDGAENALEKDYDETLKGLEADGVLDILTKEYYGDAALLYTGVACEDNPDLDEISYRFSWRVSMTTIDKE